MAGRQWMAVVAAAVIGGGAATVVASCGEDDSGVSHRGLQHRRDQHRGHGHGQRTGSVTVDTNATSAEGMDAAMSQISAYARRQTAGLVTAATALQAAVDAGSVPRPSRPTPPGAPTTSASSRWWRSSPSWTARSTRARTTSRRRPRIPTWTGFHPIERQLWKDGRITPRTRVLAAGLVGTRSARASACSEADGDPRGRDPRHRRAGGRDRGVEDHRRGGALLQARPAHLRGQPRGRARVLQRARAARRGQGPRCSRIRSTTPSTPPSTRWASRKGTGYPPYNELT